MAGEDDRSRRTDIVPDDADEPKVVPLRKSLTERQVQRGLDATRLRHLSSALDLAPTYFHDQAALAGAPCADDLRRSQAEGLARAFARIKEPFLRERVLRLVQALSHTP